jgi:hypothetical protein
MHLKLYTAMCAAGVCLYKLVTCRLPFHPSEGRRADPETLVGIRMNASLKMRLERER